MAAKKKRTTKSKVARPAAKKAAKKSPPPSVKLQQSSDGSASDRITRRIGELQDWRGEKLAVVRQMIRDADPGIIEEWKWDVPVWSRDGIICTGESYKQTIKLTFPKGASLADPRHLFNSSLAGNTRRAIDIRRDDEIDSAAFRALIRDAVRLNEANSAKSRRS